MPLFGHGNQKGKIWQKSLIHHFLRTPTVIGTLIPVTSEYVDGVRRLRPQEPVEGYYPAIIDKAEWDEVQARRKAWAEHYNISGPKTGRNNLLAGLSRCPFCDRPMELLGSTNPNWRYFICRRSRNGAGCSGRWVRYPQIEEVLTIDINEVIRSCPKPALTSNARKHILMTIRSRLYELRQRLASIIEEQPKVRQMSRPVLEARHAVEAEVERLLSDRKRLRIDRPRWLDVTLSKKLEKLHGRQGIGT